MPEELENAKSEYIGDNQWNEGLFDPLLRISQNRANSDIYWVR
jgi:hypothetical protein